MLGTFPAKTSRLLFSQSGAIFSHESADQYQLNTQVECCIFPNFCLRLTSCGIVGYTNINYQRFCFLSKIIPTKQLT